MFSNIIGNTKYSPLKNSLNNAAQLVKINNLVKFSNYFMN
jgi:hypothetical protein